MASNDIAGVRTGLAQSVLREIAERLAALVTRGESGAIDLRSLPLTSADRGELEDKLGHGDVMAKLTVAGTSELWETRYSGVWWIRHHGADDRVAAERIEIAAVPEILVAHDADIAAACMRVRADLGDDASGEPAAHD